MVSIPTDDEIGENENSLSEIEQNKADPYSDITSLQIFLANFNIKIMLIVSLLYFSLNFFVYNGSKARTAIINDYKNFVSTDTDNWTPAEALKWYGGIIWSYTAFIFHMLGYFGVITDISELIVSFVIDYLVPIFGVLSLAFAYLTEEQCYAEISTEGFNKRVAKNMHELIAWEVGGFLGILGMTQIVWIRNYEAWHVGMVLTYIANKDPLPPIPVEEEEEEGNSQ